MFRQKFLKNPPFLAIGDPFQFFGDPQKRTTALTDDFRKRVYLQTLSFNHEYKTK
jgi:hypothetical protein